MLVNIPSAIFLKFVSLALGVYSLRWLSTNTPPELYKDFNTFTPILLVVLSTSSLGLTDILRKFYFKNNQKFKFGDVWTSLFCLRIISYLPSLLAIVLLSNLLIPEFVAYGVLIFTGQFVVALDLQFKTLSELKNISWKYFASDVIGKIFFVGTLWLSIYFTNFGNSLGIKTDYLWIYAWASLFSFLIALLIDIKSFSQKSLWGKFDWEIIQHQSKNFWYLSLSSVLFNLYFTSDRLFLKYLGYTAQDINSYSNAFRLFEVSLAIPLIFAPILSGFIKSKLDYVQTNPKHNFPAYKLVAKYWLLNMFIGVIMYAIFFVFSPIAVWLIDPNQDYVSTLPMLQVLNLALVVYFNIVFLNHLNLIFGKEKEHLMSMVFLCIFAILSYIYFIPRYGAQGAAIASVVIFFLDFIIKTLLTTFYILNIQYAKYSKN